VGETAAPSLSRGMRRGQTSHADKKKKKPAREARSGRKALLPRGLVAEATALPLNIELIPSNFRSLKL